MPAFWFPTAIYSRIDQGYRFSGIALLSRSPHHREAVTGKRPLRLRAGERVRTIQCDLEDIWTKTPSVSLLVPNVRGHFWDPSSTRDPEQSSRIIQSSPMQIRVLYVRLFLVQFVPLSVLRDDLPVKSKIAKSVMVWTVQISAPSLPLKNAATIDFHDLFAYSTAASWVLCSKNGWTENLIAVARTAYRRCLGICPFESRRRKSSSWKKE